MGFLPPSLIRFGIISDLKQRNKTQWLNIGTGIQMKRKELTKTLMTISNWKTYQPPSFKQKYFSA